MCLLLYYSQLEEAAELAYQNKSEEELNLVLSKCGPLNRSLSEKVQSMKAQLAIKR